MPPIAVVGNLSRDRLGGGPPCAGGGPYHCGRALATLGIEAVLATKAARADAGLVEQLESLGLPVCWRESTSTAAFAIDHEGDERRMIVEGVGEPWRPDEVRDWLGEALGDAEWVHVAPLARSDFPAETLAELARDRRLSFDGQGLVRQARIGPLELDADYDPTVLRHVSILKLAEEEARLLVDRIDARSLATLGVPEVVVTLGSRGSIVFADGIAQDIPARPVAGVDPTGAGDAFAAVYLAARSQGEAPVVAARDATAAVAGLLR